MRRIRGTTMAVRFACHITILPLLVRKWSFMGKWSRKKGALRDIRAPSTQGLASSSYREEVEREATQVQETMEGI
jgi:hypothetical protein